MWYNLITIITVRPEAPPAPSQNYTMHVWPFLHVHMIAASCTELMGDARHALQGLKV